MKQLKDYIIESHSFLVNRKPKNRQQQYEYHPTTKEELQDIIINLLKQGITDLNCIDVTEITNMPFLFAYVNNEISVKEIDISEWNVSNVENMYGIFRGCKEFNSDLSKWNVSNVTNMYNMFDTCHKFNSDLSKWNVSNVKYMNSMFKDCYEFNSDLSKWNVSNVKYMYNVFLNCNKFNSDLSKWNVSNVTDMDDMFYGCATLIKNNKIPKWYTGQV